MPSSDWIAVQLGRVKGNRSEAEASHDFAEYLPPPRREMMARWSADVTGLAAGNVQALPSHVLLAFFSLPIPITFGICTMLSDWRLLRRVGICASVG